MKMFKGRDIKKLNEVLGNDPILLYAVEEIVDRMLLNIYMGSEISTEVMFATSCLEVVFDRSFTEDQEIRIYVELVKIIKKRLQRSQYNK